MRTSLRLLAALSLLLLAACAGGGSSSQQKATIEGKVSGAQSLTVAVPGTALKTTTTQSGGFVLLDVPAGTSALRFTGTNTDATLPITAVVSSEHRTLSVTVSGSDAQEEHEQTGTEYRGKVSAVTSPTLTVAGRTVTTTATTIFKQGDKTITLADIKVGDEVEVHGTLQADGTVLASEIDDGVSEDEGGVAFAGELVSITDATHISVGGIPVVLSATTDIRRRDAKITAADLKVGDRLLVKGSIQSGVTVAASAIRVLEADHDVEAHVAGPLAAISLSDHTMTIGKTTIAFDDHTKFSGEGGLHSAADLKIGDPLMVEAGRRADGSLLAQEVHRVPPQPPPGTELHGAISAIAADGKSLTLDSHTVAVDANTKFGGAGDPKSLADFKVGDLVVVGAKMQADKSLLAIFVYRKPAGSPPPLPGIELQGAITAIAADGKSITIGDHSVLVDASTKFGGDGAPKSLADFKVGDMVKVHAAAAADGSVHALSIEREAHDGGALEVKGTISELRGDGLSVNGHAFAVDSATVITIGANKAALADLKVGQPVDVHAKGRAGMTPLATSVHAE